jgi:hypothetical protein
VKAVDHVGSGLRLSPGIRLTQTKDRPAIATMMQGAKLELRLPNGSIIATTLLTYGVSVWRGDDGGLYVNDDAADAEIKLTLPGDHSAADIPVGTEVWLVE